MADQIPTKDLRKPGGVGSNEPKPPATPPAPKEAAPSQPTVRQAASTVAGGFSHVNKHILVATTGLVVVGIIRTWGQPSQKQGKVLAGGFVVLLVLSVLDLFGGGASKVASGLAMVALVGGVLNAIPAGFIANLAGNPTPSAQPFTGTQNTQKLGGA